MTDPLAPQFQAEDRCYRCSTVFAEHGATSQLYNHANGHFFTPVPRGLVREFVLTDQARRELAELALFGRRA